MLPRPIDNYWANFFGLEPSTMGMPGRHVVAHAGLGDYQGAWVFRRDQTTIVSVPRDALGSCERELAAGPLPEHTNLPAWGHIFGRSITKVIGPAYDGFLPSDASIASPPGVRPLHREDRSLLDGLKTSCTVEEWDHASVDPESDEPLFGFVVGDRLIGVAQNEPRTAAAVAPGVVTASDWRKRGVGAAVLAAACHHAITTGRLVLYQTLLANRASVRLGESVGVAAYAVHHAFRFAADGSDG